MRVNTKKSLELAQEVKKKFGTWQAVREASRVVNGVYVIEKRPSANIQKVDYKVKKQIART